MSAATLAKLPLPPEEYLAQERSSPVKHAFLNGEIFEMAGGSREHSLIATNVAAELRAALRSSPCEVHGSDLRVYVPATGLFTYPDASIACPPQFLEDKRPDTLINPAVLVEVLSDTTEAYDRGEKFEHYRTIVSLTDYILIAQNRVLIERYTRQPDGGWLMHEIRAGGRLQLAFACGEFDVPVREIYMRVFAL